MNDTTLHLPDLTLEQLAEGTLPDDERAGAAAHVARCGRCAAQVEGYLALFATLAELPRFAPSPTFGDAVMARVRVAPAPSAAVAWARRWMPKTRRGWTLLGAAIATPAVSLVAAMAWLLSHPLVSPASLWQWGRGELMGGVEAGLTQVVRWGVDSGLFGAAQMALEALRALPLGTVAVVVAVLAVAIPLSAWSLIRLVRTPMETVNYAN